MTGTKNSNNSILVLPSWYPCKINAFSGDFIQRHVKAISLYNKQYIIYVVKDDKGIVTADITVEEKIHDNYAEQIIYYKPVKTGISLLDKLLSQQKYKRVYRKAIADYIHLNGRPKMIHVHVAFKAGMLALWAKKQWGIPYIVTEHWTIYLKEADLRYEQFSFIHRKLIKKTMELASAITAVSDWLGKAIQNRFPSVNYKVIPNVVDTNIFFPVEKIPNNTIQFIHASTMNYQKNIEAIIYACSILKKNIDFVLKLFGPVPASVIALVQDLNLQTIVLFKGDVTQHQLAIEMQQSDALILYSRFETFGCVLIEANAAGIPVIVSDIPVFHELVEENINGLFVQESNNELLAEILIEFVSRKNQFNKTTMVNGTEKYSFNSVGKQFDELYRQVIA